MKPPTARDADFERYLAERLTARNLAGGFMVMLAVLALLWAFAGVTP